jgi:hypothetical protein
VAPREPEILTRVLSDFELDHEEHRQAVEVYDRRYRAYKGMIEKRSEAQMWTPKFHPAYVWQSIETMVANLVDANPHWRIHVHPQMADPARMQELQDGARANELLLRHQLTLDRWAEKQRPFDLQGLICGITAAKQSWAYREGQRRYNDFYSEPFISAFGLQIGTVSKQREMSATEVLRDDPTSEVVDVRHLIFQRGAVSLERSDRITHRCFYSYEQLKRMECRHGSAGHEGECEPGRYYHDVDQLKKSHEGGISPDRFQREEDLFGERPHRDDYEILEQWRREGETLRCVAFSQSPKVLLADRPSPYWLDHLEHPFPFVVCSGSPDLFRIPGISEAEMMAELQELLWTYGGQRLINLEHVNAAIVMLADDLEDQDLVFAPGEQWLLPRPVEESVKMWAPDVRAAQVSLEAEALLKGDLQNITGGMPFLSGTNTSNIDQQTATGVSIITSLAQKRLSAKRQQFVWAKGRIGEQWTALNQQYVREPRKVPVIGEGGYEAFEEIKPELLQGLYLFETEITDESMNRAERRAEAQAKFQVAMQAAPAMAAMGSPINARAFMEDVLDSYDVTDKERYFSAAPQPPGLPSQGAPPQPGGNGGITNEALAAGPSSPSSDISMSPANAMQQLMSQAGGSANAPG